jgi:hypothetical protein
VTKAAAATGMATEPARADHKHDVTTAAAGAVAIGDAATEGSATSLARSDHTHSLAAPAAPAAPQPLQVLVRQPLARTMSMLLGRTSDLCRLSRLPWIPVT